MRNEGKIKKKKREGAERNRRKEDGEIEEKK